MPGPLVIFDSGSQFNDRQLPLCPFVGRPFFFLLRSFSDPRWPVRRFLFLLFARSNSLLTLTSIERPARFLPDLQFLLSIFDRDFHSFVLHLLSDRRLSSDRTFDSGIFRIFFLAFRFGCGFAFIQSFEFVWWTASCREAKFFQQVCSMIVDYTHALRNIERISYYQ